MAMDTRRYRSQGEHQTSVSISSSSIPGLIILAIGVVVIIIGIILMAAFGVPNNLSEDPEDISGVIVVAVGLVICVCGVVYTRKLKIARKRAAHGKKVKHQQRKQRNVTTVSRRTQEPVSYPQDNRQTYSIDYNHTHQGPDTGYGYAGCNHHQQDISDVAYNHNQYESGVTYPGDYNMEVVQYHGTYDPIQQTYSTRVDS